MKYLPFAAVLVILGVGTILEGKYSDRWGQATSEKLDRFTENLADVPLQIGDWTGVDEEIDPEEFKASHCTGCVSRTYTNLEGQRVNMYLVSGSARHITIHTPDWCYVGAGYKMVDDPQQYTLQDSEGLPSAPEFLTTVFRKEDPLYTHNIRIFWSFSDDGNWLGPRMPKPYFAGRSALYKIYLITDLDQSDGEIEKDPAREFARDILPVLNRVLFPAESEEVAAAS